ncbi:MAG: PAS domain-containing protein [Desulfobacteraceae bacterium]|nr:MAG: PAS domain-containing protein [Desulfobacteraceae bacterium]
MNIAIVGGGPRCEFLMDFMLRNDFHTLNPRVVALAHDGKDTPCLRKAAERDIFITSDYNELFDRDDIDLIIELTGKDEVFYDILSKKKKTVRAFDSKTAELFWEVSRVSQLHRKAEEELVKTRVLYTVFINQLLQEDVMIISPSYRIIDANDTLLKKLGLKREEVVGKTCFEISHHRTNPCEGEHHPCPLRQALSSRKPSQTTHVHLDKDKNEHHYAISCYPIFEGSEIVALVEISKDITRDIEIQRVMMQQEKLASVGRLAAGVAHEINNPLTTILTTAMLIQEDMGPDDPLFKDLQTIADETLRCRKIVTNLLDFAKQSRPSKKKSDVNQLVNESVALIKKQAAFKNVEVALSLVRSLPEIYLDKNQIQQCVINLGLNAIEATDAGGEVSFETEYLPGDDAVAIRVKDTGKGIPEENATNIFEPFFTTKDTGTGLGLAITHGFIQQHGGAISFDSKVGAGTTFTIRLPVKGNEQDI